MSDDTDRMRRAYPNDPPVTARIKMNLEGVAIYSDIASDARARCREDDNEFDRDRADRHFAMRTKNMESIHRQLDALRERCERLRQVALPIGEDESELDHYRALDALHPGDLADDLIAPSATAAGTDATVGRVIDACAGS